MGYVFRARPADLSGAVLPRFVAQEAQGLGVEQLTSVLLSTVLAVPAFGKLLGEAIGAPGLATGGRVEAYCAPVFAGQSGASAEAPPDALLRLKSLARFGALIDVAPQTFDEANDERIGQIAEHLHLTRERKLQRLVLLSGTVPSHAFLSALKAASGLQSLERLRFLTWMQTVDIAFHLLETKKVRDPVGVFLLEQFIDTMKTAATQDVQAKADRPQGAIYFASLGEDWREFFSDLSAGGAFDPKDPRLPSIATNWLAYLRFAAFNLSRGGGREQDMLAFPNVLKGGARLRRGVVLNKLRTSGQLTATFRKRGEATGLHLCVDLKKGEITLQVRLPTQNSAAEGTEYVRKLARAVSDQHTVGQTQIKIFWPGEKTPRTVMRSKAIAEPVSTAPPQHGLTPERFIVERAIACTEIIGVPENFVQLLTLELRSFRGGCRHILRHGAPS